MDVLLQNTTAKKVMIDHHLFPNLTQFDLSFSFPDRCSTCELLLELFLALDGKVLISEACAQFLYLGIVTDTGSFRYNSVRKETHELVATLLDLGVNHTKVHEATFDDNTLDRIKLRSFVLSECLELWKAHEMAVLFLTDNDARRLNMQKGDTEGLVNVGLSIEGVKKAAFFKEQDDYVRISFRSKDGFEVNTLAREHFEGGGHAQAAGGRFDGTIKDAILKLRKVLDDEK
jgi:phosphoesterase RecJ-like protein